MHVRFLVMSEALCLCDKSLWQSLYCSLREGCDGMRSRFVEDDMAFVVTDAVSTR